jgi:hypothetical protein
VKSEAMEVSFEVMEVKEYWKDSITDITSITSIT